MNTKDLSRTDNEKNEIAKYCREADHNFSWDQKKVVDSDRKSILRKIKEIRHYLRTPNNFNKSSYMLPEIWLSN